MIRRLSPLYLLALLAFSRAAAQESQDPLRICLAPASVEASTGDATTVVDAVRATFTSFLTGPSLEVKPLAARLQSQAREEARSAGCDYLLLTTVKDVRTRGGGGPLGRIASRAAQHGAWTVGATAGSRAGRIAASAAAGAASEAAYAFASSVRTRDELSLACRLESPAGAVLLERTEQRKAQEDGEDLLTPLVEHAAEAIVAAAVR